MIFKRVFLEKDNETVYLDAYVADPLPDFTRKAILVIPGGAYWDVCADREGEPIAMAFMAQGYNAFVLHYSVRRKKKFPAQLIEASLAMKHIKENAKEYNIDPEKVFVTGFSAGGHLAGSLGLMWNKKEIYDAVEMPYGYNKPAGMMLVYPVVSSNPEYGHLPSFYNLLCNSTPEAEELKECSLEQQVSADAASLFLVHTSNDDLVDVRNSLCLAEKYRENGLQFELHVYPDAPHGVALGNAITRCGVEKWDNKSIAKWVENAVAWADSL